MPNARAAGVGYLERIGCCRSGARPDPAVAGGAPRPPGAVAGAGRSSRPGSGPDAAHPPRLPSGDDACGIIWLGCGHSGAVVPEGLSQLLRSAAKEIEGPGYGFSVNKSGNSDAEVPEQGSMQQVDRC